MRLVDFMKTSGQLCDVVISLTVLPN